LIAPRVSRLTAWTPPRASITSSTLPSLVSLGALRLLDLRLRFAAGLMLTPQKV
jgi:hypothetical protein